MTNISASPGFTVISGSKQPIYTTGVVRWNGETQNLEVMGNGSTWHTIYESPASIDFDTETKILLGWVRRRVADDLMLSQYCEKYPGLKDLKEKYEIMLALVRQEENSDK